MRKRETAKERHRERVRRERERERACVRTRAGRERGRVVDAVADERDGPAASWVLISNRISTALFQKAVFPLPYTSTGVSTQVFARNSFQRCVFSTEFHKAVSMSRGVWFQRSTSLSDSSRGGSWACRKRSNFNTVHFTTRCISTISIRTFPGAA